MQKDESVQSVEQPVERSRESQEEEGAAAVDREIEIESSKSEAEVQVQVQDQVAQKSTVSSQRADLSCSFV